MKKIVSVIFCAVFISATAFAEDDSINTHIANTLFVLFKITNSATPVNANNYERYNYVYNGIVITAFTSKTTNWIGFFENLSATELPANALSQINSTFKNCTIQNAVIYFTDSADIIYYAEIKLQNKYIFLKIDSDGNVNVFDELITKV